MLQMGFRETLLNARAVARRLNPLTAAQRAYYFGNLGRQPLVIAVNGEAGAGKSTFIEGCRRKLGIDAFESSYRQLARPGEGVADVRQRARNDPTVDFEVEEKALTRAHEAAGKPGALFIGGRMAPFLHRTDVRQILETKLDRSMNVPSGDPIHIRLLLVADPDTAGKRNFGNPQKRGQEGLTSAGEAARKIRERNEHDRAHYRAVYGVDNIFGFRHYDIVIDTSNKTPNEVLRIALQEIRRVRLKKFGRAGR